VTFDLVVIGGGSAGCVVAARASDDPSRRVLLVEAGPDPQPVPDVVADPKRQAELVRTSPYVRRYDVHRPDGSSFPLLSGRIIGGGSAVNNLAAIRPMRRDFDDWQRFGGTGWSYDALLPLMRDIESDPDFGDSALHGVCGPLRLERPMRLDGVSQPAVAALLDAAADLGLPPCPDINVAEPFGVCSSPYNLVDGRRQSAADAWLGPARGRSNLEIRADTSATRLLVEGSRVTGVELRGAGATGDVERVDAREVVLAAGVYHSPQVLMLSGIGPVEELERLGIPLVHALEGVGRNLQDHAVVNVAFAGAAALDDDFVMPKVRLVARSDPARDAPDLHVFMRPAVRAAGRAAALPVSLHLLEHRSTGRVRLASGDPDDLPIVEPALLDHAGDVRALIDGISLVRRLTRHPRLAAYYGALLEPAAEDTWERHVRATYFTYHHGVGTCRIGPPGDPGAVVDASLRVHGIDGLRVADASILPTVPHANTNLAAILVGEVAAREIEGTRSAPAVAVSAPAG
jgi:choline dehydrogenase